MRVTQMETSLSHRYTYLAKIYTPFPEVARECILTAFSLNPCDRTYSDVRHCAHQFWAQMKSSQVAYRTRQQSNISRHFRSLCSNDDGKENKAYNPKAMPSFIYDHPALQKCITEELANDLMNLINAPRIKTLSWSVSSWSELESRCGLLLDNSEFKRRNIAMNLPQANKKLKYVHMQEIDLMKCVLKSRVQQLGEIKAKDGRFHAIIDANNKDFLGFKIWNDITDTDSDSSGTENTIQNAIKRRRLE